MRPLPAYAVATALALAAACTRSAPAPDPAYLADLAKWHAAREASLRREDGWLTLVGLHWLKPGVNRVGSAPGVEVPLPDKDVPPVAGTLGLAADGAVTLRTSPEAGFTVDGQPVSERVLRSDRTGAPDVVALGTVRFHLIERGDGKAIRVRDTASPRRTAFAGIPTFPADLRYRVEGRFEPYAAPREVQVPSAHGPAQTMLAAGVIRFRLDGRDLSLEPFVSEPGDPSLFIVFRDATAGTETYGAGRFLAAAAPKPGSDAVILDFNRATNPPCAFTPFATCPLPPPANVLPVPIPAGEKAPVEPH